MFQLRVNKHCEGTWFGLSTGVTRLVGTSPKRFQVGEKVLIALHIAGHRYWSSLNQPWVYAPAQFHVCNAVYLGLEQQQHLFEVEAIPAKLEFSQRTKPTKIFSNPDGSISCLREE